MQKRLNIKDFNAYRMFYRHNVIKLNAWYVQHEGKYNPTYNMRCNWCKKSFWEMHEDNAYPRFCKGCGHYLYRLENPLSLVAIQNEDFGDIPF